MTHHAPSASMPLGSVPRWTWSSVAGAALATALLFFALPGLERMTVPPVPELQLRAVEIAVLPPRPPPPPPLRAPEPPPNAPKPVLKSITPRLTPLALSLSLGAAMGGFPGDFFTDFTIAGLEAGADTGPYIFEISDLDEPPRPRVQLPPAYPAPAKMRRIEGHVDLVYVVAVDGSVQNVHVTASQPPGVFDASAIQAVRRWRFQPGIRQSVAVPTRVQQRLDFQLE